jgi:ABC-type nitrate/sulfonate/bicarbonate transport system permease component
VRGRDASKPSRPRLHLLTAAGVAGLLLVWELWASGGGPRVLFFPAPSDWVGALKQLWESGLLLADLTATAKRFGTGLTLGVLSGWVGGIALGSAPRLRIALDPIVALVHPLPKISLYPLLLLILGFGEAPKIAVVLIATFFPMFVNTLHGVREVDRTLLEAVRSFRATRLMVLRRIVIPGSVPFVLAGLRLAMNTGLTVAVAVELITAGDGLGSRIWFAWQNLRIEQLYAVLLVIAFFGLMVNSMLERLARVLAPWKVSS